MSMRVPRKAQRAQSVFRRGRWRLLFQLIELLFERGKARHEPAIGKVAGRFFLNKVPAFGRILLDGWCFSGLKTCCLTRFPSER